MARFRVKETSFINNQLHLPGAIVDIDTSLMSPGSNLDPLEKDPEAKAAAKAVEDTPKAAATLAEQVMLHAATRGDLPTNANDEDFAEVIAARAGSKPAPEVVKAAQALVAAKRKALEDHAAATDVA